MTVGQLANLEFQKSYLWSVGGIGGGEIYAESATLPTYSGDPIDINLRGAYKRDVGVYKPGNLELTFYDSPSGIVQKALFSWAKAQYDPAVGCGTKNTKEVTVSLEGCGGGGGITYTLKGAFITSFNPQRLTSDNTSMFQVSCSIACDDLSL